MPLLNEKYRLDNYIVGENNKIAHCAALEILESPGGLYNPLFLYGETGTGKTHLLSAIGRAYKEQKPDMNVIYVTAEEMIRDIIESIRHNRIKEMRERFNNADVLIVDDIQLIAGKEASQEEFFYLFNTVHNNGKQIILSANMDPHKMEGLEGRILSRFMWGFVAEITSPDFEMRKSLIYEFAVSHDVSLSPTVVEYIANKMSSNIFVLEGLIKTIKLHAEANDVSPEELTVVDVEKLMHKESKQNDPVDDSYSDVSNGMYEINDEIVNEAIRNMTATANYDGIKTGFETLDYLINGFGRGQLIVLGARPVMGKTTFACSVVDNVCIKGKRTCMYFSSSESKESIVQRLIRIHGDLKCDYKDIKRVPDSATDIVVSPLWIDDTPAIYVDEIIQKCREMRESREIDLIVVDYLQLLSDITEKENSTLAEQKQIIGKLKNLAEELQCPILILSQLNRSAEKRTRHFPTVADFPTHLALGRYADVILLLYREFYYYMRENQNHATLHVARSKNKSGIATSLRYDPDIPKFRDWREEESSKINAKVILSDEIDQI